MTPLTRVRLAFRRLLRDGTLSDDSRTIRCWECVWTFRYGRGNPTLKREAVACAIEHVKDRHPTEYCVGAER